MVAPKPDCTGQRFGYLTVLGKSSDRVYAGIKNRRNNSYYPWVLQCDCGKIIELRRGDFDNKTKRGQKSCGCMRGINVRKGQDITGQKFGQLTAIGLAGKRISNKEIWIFRCKCGEFREMSLGEVRQSQKKGYRITCKNNKNHPDKYLEYPPTPIPYPKEAGEILKKYLYLTELEESSYCRIGKCDTAAQDDKKDRLIRAAWIITYRRQQGEQITPLHEKRIIHKHLRYSSIHVFWQSKIESQGGLLYDNDNKKRSIGGTMTDATSHNYPELELEGINMLPANNIKPAKRLKFKRC